MENRFERFCYLNCPCFYILQRSVLPFFIDLTVRVRRTITRLGIIPLGVSSKCLLVVASPHQLFGPFLEALVPADGFHFQSVHSKERNEMSERRKDRWGPTSAIMALSFSAWELITGTVRAATATLGGRPSFHVSFPKVPLTFFSLAVVTIW